MKKALIAICLGVLSAISAVCMLDTAQQTVANGVIRLHIRAHSNAEHDQELKLKVRDRILTQAGDLFSNTETASSAKVLAGQNLHRLRAIAQDEVRKNGYGYDVRVSLGKSDFPTKTYSGLTLPAGTYEALIVEIGSGRGENWWCVMFPPLCFVDEACVGVDKKTEDILIDNLGGKTYDMLKNDDIEIRFKLLEWVEGIAKR